MQERSHRRRFIAGAVCPRCALMDKIVVDLNTDQRLCVSCGFSEGRPGMPAEGSHVAEGSHPAEGSHVDAAQKPLEIQTRVSRAAARRVETPAQAITLIDPLAKGDKPED